MFIAKTAFDKGALIALQKQMINTSRANYNDLVAIEYVFNSDVKSTDVLKAQSQFDSLIRYTFFWTLEYCEVINYQHIGVDIYTQKAVKDDGTPIWGCLLDATLYTWLNYCQSDHPKKFIEVVRGRLVTDGYALRLGRNLCQLK